MRARDICIVVYLCVICIVVYVCDVSTVMHERDICISHVMRCTHLVYVMWWMYVISVK